MIHDQSVWPVVGQSSSLWLVQTYAVQYGLDPHDHCLQLIISSLYLLHEHLELRLRLMSILYKRHNYMLNACLRPHKLKLHEKTLTAKVLNGLLIPLLHFLLHLQKLTDGFLGQAELHLHCCAQRTDVSQH